MLESAIHSELQAANRPLGAYELIDALGRSIPPAPSPMQVYRALDRLVTARRVLRIASTASYIVSSSRPAAVLHCRICGHAELVPADAIHGGLAEAARMRGFRPRETVIEVLGVCAACDGAAG